LVDCLPHGMFSIALKLAECLLQNNLDQYHTQQRLHVLSCLHGHMAFVQNPKGGLGERDGMKGQERLSWLPHGRP